MARGLMGTITASHFERKRPFFWKKTIISRWPKRQIPNFQRFRVTLNTLFWTFHHGWQPSRRSRSGEKMWLSVTDSFNHSISHNINALRRCDCVIGKKATIWGNRGIRFLGGIWLDRAFKMGLACWLFWTATSALKGRHISAQVANRIMEAI